MKELEKNNLNWDNNFSIRFTLKDGRSLEKIPNNIFMIELPEIKAVDMDSEDFHIDEISIDDFKTENDRNDFIEMISDEIGIMESLVDELTETINKKILERLKH